jgi:CBS domain-containing protein
MPNLPSERSVFASSARESAMKASDVMVSDVISVGEDACVQDAAKLLLKHRISAVPVVNGKGELVGIVSEGDLVRRAESGTARPSSWWLELLKGNEERASDFVREHSRRIADVMTRELVTVPPDSELGDIVSLLERHSIKRVPVVENGKLVGIVSRANLLQGLAAISKTKEPRATVEDGKLRQQVVDKLKTEHWAPLHLNVTVTGGVVDVWGLVNSPAEKTATRVAVEEVPGVKAVNDNLSIMRSVAYGA